MDVTGDLEVPRHSNEAAPAVEQTNGSTGSNGVASSDADSGGDTGMVPRHVVDELRKKRRDLEVRVEEAEKREREWAAEYRRSVDQSRAQPTAAAPDILDDPDLDEDERRFIQLERSAKKAKEEAQSATNLVRKMEMESEVRRYVSEANSRASEQGLPINIEEGDIYARIVGNVDGRFGRDVKEVVKNFYNKEFEKVEAIRESEQNRSKQAAEAGRMAGETGGKLPTPTPPTPVDFSEVPHKDLWQKAEEATVEALQRMKRG